MGPPHRRNGMERAARAGADVQGDDLRASRAGRWTAVAVLRRAASRRAVPAWPPVEGAARRPRRAVLSRRARPAARAARRRISVPAHYGTATRFLQHRRTERWLYVAAAARRDARHLAGRRRAPGPHGGRLGPGFLAPR